MGRPVLSCRRPTYSDLVLQVPDLILVSRHLVELLIGQSFSTMTSVGADCGATGRWCAIRSSAHRAPPDQLRPEAHQCQLLISMTPIPSRFICADCLLKRFVLRFELIT